MPACARPCSDGPDTHPWPLCLRPFHSPEGRPSDKGAAERRSEKASGGSVPRGRLGGGCPDRSQGAERAGEGAGPGLQWDWPFLWDSRRPQKTRGQEGDSGRLARAGGSTVEKEGSLEGQEVRRGAALRPPPPPPMHRVRMKVEEPSVPRAPTVCHGCSWGLLPRWWPQQPAAPAWPEQTCLLPPVWLL